MTVATSPDFATAWESFTRASRRARSRSTGPLGGTGLTLAQFQLLEPLRATEEMTVSELAQAAGVAAPTATRMLDGLVRAGAAERTPCATDRRVVLVSLTAAGRATVEEAWHQVAAARARVRDSLTDEEQAQAAVLLGKLAEAIDAL
jgi:DNA-binding MarR family transcriptional regulator